jgi:small multidrug resistance pump
MNPYFALAVAIVTEVVATSSLRASHGFTRLGPSLLVIVGYGIAFYLMSIVLRSLPLGTAYAIWSGVGTAATAVVSWAVYKDHLTPLTAAGIALVIAGIIVMNLSGAHR